jgi:hypothetical protein
MERTKKMKVIEQQLPVGEIAELLYPENEKDYLLTLRAMFIAANSTNYIYSGFFSQYKIIHDFVRSNRGILHTLPSDYDIDFTSRSLWYSTFYPTCHYGNPNYELLWQFAYSEKYQTAWGKLLKEMRKNKQENIRYTIPVLGLSFYSPYESMYRHSYMFEKIEQIRIRYLINNEEYEPILLNMRQWLEEANKLNVYSIDNVKIYSIDKRAVYENT